MVGEHNTLTRLVHHGSVNSCLVRIVCREPVFVVGAINSDKGLVKKHLADITLRHISYEGKPVTTKRPSRHGHFDLGQVTQFHCDVDSIGDDADALAMSEGLIEHWRHGAGASVIATQQPLSFKLAQVAPDRSTGDFKVSG